MKRPRKPEPGEKWCYKCSRFKPPSNFYSDANRGDGLSNMCRSCFHVRQHQQRTQTGYYTSDRRRARHYLHYAKRRKLIAQLPCAVCKDPDTEAHHHRGYAKPYWLDVIWLCQKHHYELEHPKAAA